MDRVHIPNMKRIFAERTMVVVGRLQGGKPNEAPVGRLGGCRECCARPNLHISTCFASPHRLALHQECRQVRSPRPTCRTRTLYSVFLQLSSSAKCHFSARICRVLPVVRPPTGDAQRLGIFSVRSQDAASVPTTHIHNLPRIQASSWRRRHTLPDKDIPSVENLVTGS